MIKIPFPKNVDPFNPVRITLPESHNNIWVNINNIGVGIVNTGEGVVVDLWPLQDDGYIRNDISESITSTWASFQEAEEDEVI